MLLRNDPLDAVWRESEMALAFARKAQYRDVADVIVSQQRFIATMQGRTASFSSFSDAHFDEATFEAQLSGDRATWRICLYWILKLEARFLSGDYGEALAAANNVKPLLSAVAIQIQRLDYFYYTALTVSAVYEGASANQQQEWRDLLTAHREQLREWADNYPPTFADKHALVSAEIARLEGRAFDAMQLYEQAIQSAREHGFVQNEALAHEVAARFYLARGLETIGRLYLRNARSCYVRWGALGKLKQLDERYPHMREAQASTSLTATIGTPVGQLDVETVVKASQALSGEIVLPSLIETLMRIAVEHAGAERGLLVLLRGDEPEIEAEATTGGGRVEVIVREAAVITSALPPFVLHYVMRARESVVLDDASVTNPFSEDEYVRQRRPRSVLCLPIVKQTKLVGALYLENNLTPRAFTSDRVAVLELLASQAAISLENARLYSDLQRSEAFLAEGQGISSTGSWGWSVPSEEVYWSEETYRIFEYDRAVKPTLELALQRIHPDDRALVQHVTDRASNDGANFDTEFRLLTPDGRVKYLHLIAHAQPDTSGNLEFVGAVTDITSAKGAAEALRQSQADLAHVSRVTTLGEMAASIAHEVDQPLSGVVINANACLRFLRHVSPDLDEVQRRLAVHRTRRPAGERGDCANCALARRTATEKEPVDIDELIREVVTLVEGEARRTHARLRAELAGNLPHVLGDRVQLQQVVLNLLLNALDAMRAVEDRPRELVIRTQQDAADRVRVAVQDTGSGIDPQLEPRIFEPFYTTKHSGMGMGLRSAGPSSSSTVGDFGLCRMTVPAPRSTSRYDRIVAA